MKGDLRWRVGEERMRHAGLFAVAVLLLAVMAGCAGGGGVRDTLHDVKTSYDDSVKGSYQPVAP
jgi:hypothetical protein